MVIECVAAAAAAVSVVITAELYGAQARAGYFTLLFVRLCIFFIFCVDFFFNFRVELASRARRRRRSVGSRLSTTQLIYWAHLSTTTSFTAT